MGEDSEFRREALEKAASGPQLIASGLQSIASGMRHIAIGTWTLVTGFRNAQSALRTIRSGFRHVWRTIRKTVGGIRNIVRAGFGSVVLPLLVPLLQGLVAALLLVRYAAAIVPTLAAVAGALVGLRASTSAPRRGAKMLLSSVASLVPLALLRLAGLSVTWRVWIVAIGLAHLFILGFTFRTFRRRSGPPRPDADTERRSPRLFTDEGSASSVDAFDTVWGSTRPGGCRFGSRTVHSHGNMLTGVFEVDPNFRQKYAADLPFFTPQRQRSLEVLARFSNFDGGAERDDQRLLRKPHGLAVRILSDDEVFDLVMIDAPAFVVRDRDDMNAFALSLARSSAGTFLRFVWLVIVGRASFGALRRSLTGSTTWGYADREYFGINTFWWRLAGTQRPTFADRRGVPMRASLKPIHKCFPLAEWTGRPHAPSRHLLERHLEDHLTLAAPFRFVLELTDGSSLPDDRLLDSTRAWPASCPTIRVGEVKLDKLTHLPLDRSIAFNPHNLPAGILASDDEVLVARRGAYVEAARRRFQRTEALQLGLLARIVHLSQLQPLDAEQAAQIGYDLKHMVESAGAAAAGFGDAARLLEENSKKNAKGWAKLREAVRGFDFDPSCKPTEGMREELERIKAAAREAPAAI